MKIKDRLVEMVENYSLKDLKIGEQAVVIGFTTEDVPAKFYEMGFVPGTNLLVKNKAPFGGCIFASVLYRTSLF